MEENNFDTPQEVPNNEENLSNNIPDVPEIPHVENQENTDLRFVKELVDRTRNEVQKVIIGQDDIIDQLMVAFFSGGHVLLEGTPGVAKTLIVKMLAKTFSIDFGRIQFTPDLMPTDVLGVTVFNMKTSEFEFKKGPIFSNFILIDEINRAPAKTQAALFEVMEEQQITMDGTEYKIDFPLFIIATQNPIEQEGTYKLPEAQLDRFLFKLNVKYPSFDNEFEILKRYQSDFNQKTEEDVKSVCTVDELKKCCDIIEQVHMKEELLAYIAKIVDGTRNNGDLFLGGSPRASLALMKTSKAMAAIKGRDFVTPDDIRDVSVPVLNHRLILSPEREMEGVTIDEVIKDIIESIEVPR